MAMTTPPPPSTRPMPSMPAGGAPRPGGSPVPTSGAGLGVSAIDPVRMLRVYWPFMLGAGVLGIMIGIAAFIALLQFAPKFTAETRFEVRGMVANAYDANPDTSAMRVEIPLFMETQVLMMKSDAVLEQTVNEPDVRATNWAKQFIDDNSLYDAETAKEALAEAVSSRVIDDTYVMQLKATVSKPKEDSATICNALARVYLTEANAQMQSVTRSLLLQAEQQVSTLQSELETIDKRIDNVLKGAQLTTLQQKDSLYQEEIRHLQPQIVVLRDEIAKAQTQLSYYEQMSKNGIIPETIRGEVERMPVIQQQDAAIIQEKALLRAAREKYGDAHRDVKRRIGIIAALEQERESLIDTQTRELFNSTKESLATTISRYSGSLEELETRLGDAQEKLQAITVALQQHENLQAERNKIMDQRAAIEKDRDNLRGLINRAGRIRRISEARIPDRPSFPSLIPVVGLSTFLICGLVGGVIVLREIQEQRVRTPQDVSLIPRTRVLGVVPELTLDFTNPKVAETASLDCPQGVIAEAVRQIRTDLVRDCQKNEHKTVLFVGGMPGSGSTSMATNVAINAALTDLKVLLIDANFRRPSLNEVLDVPLEPGLGDLLCRKVEIDDAVHAGPVDNLHVMGAGAAENRAYERFTTERMREIMRIARDKYDFIILDAPPAVVSGDALALCNHCDACVLVVRAYSEKRGLVARLRNQFSDSRAEFMGVIVNAARHSAGGYFKRNFKAAHEYQKAAMTADGKAKKGKKA